MGGLEPRARQVLERLRQALDAAGFHGLYKYAAGVNNYFVSPFAIHARRRPLAQPDTFVSGRASGLGLLACLAADGDVPLAQLSASEQELARELEEIGLLRLDQEILRPGDLQLVSARDLYLLIDSRINFPSGTPHQTYIGLDTYLLAYYVDWGRLTREHSVWEPCTGTGALALAAAARAAQVLATDVDPGALRLAQINRELNDASDRLEIRAEDLHETLASGASFDLVLCNPPFVAFPPGLDAPVFARGPGADGLDLVRLLVRELPSILRPGGRALLVADLVGDGEGPHLRQELEAAAERDRLAIDVFVDGCLPASAQARALAAHLARFNPGRDVAGLRDEVRTFQRESLRAAYYYLSVVLLRRAGPAARGVRVLDRHRAGRERRFRRLLDAN